MTTNKLSILYHLFCLIMLLTTFILVYLLFINTLITGEKANFILNTFTEQLIETILLTLCIPGILTIYYKEIYDEHKKIYSG